MLRRIVRMILGARADEVWARRGVLLTEQFHIAAERLVRGWSRGDEIILGLAIAYLEGEAERATRVAGPEDIAAWVRVVDRRPIRAAVILMEAAITAATRAVRLARAAVEQERYVQHSVARSLANQREGPQLYP